MSDHPPDLTCAQSIGASVSRFDRETVPPIPGHNWHDPWNFHIKLLLRLWEQLSSGRDQYAITLIAGHPVGCDAMVENYDVAQEMTEDNVSRRRQVTGTGKKGRIEFAR